MNGDEDAHDDRNPRPAPAGMDDGGGGRRLAMLAASLVITPLAAAAAAAAAEESSPSSAPLLSSFGANETEAGDVVRKERHE